MKFDSENLGDAFIEAYNRTDEKGRQGVFYSSNEALSYLINEFESILNENSLGKLESVIKFTIEEEGKDFILENGNEEFFNAISGNLNEKMNSVSN